MQSIVLAAALCSGLAAQEDDGLSRATAAMLEATALRAQSDPDTLDETLIERIASFGTPRALEVLTIALQRAERPSVRACALCSLGHFADRGGSASALLLLEDCGKNPRSAVEAEAACRALEAFGDSGRQILRQQAQQCPSFLGRLPAIESMTGWAQPVDGPLLSRVARGELMAEWRRLGLPAEPGPWTQRESLLRARALSSLCSLRSAEEAAPLLQDPDPVVQAEALRLLSLAADRRSWIRAGAVLTDPEAEAELARAAILALARSRSDNALDEVLAVARSPRSELHADALSALLQWPAEQLSARLLPLASASSPRDDALLAVDLLHRAGSLAAVSGLRRLLDHREPLVRCAAIDALGRLRARDALADLRGLSRSRDLEVRGTAILALSRLQPLDREWREQVAGLCRHRRFPLRLAATRSLLEFGDRSVLPLLRELAADPDWRVRWVALEGFQKIRATASIPFLLSRLAGERQRLREKLLTTLRSLTAAPLGNTPNEWTRWWRDHNKDFVLPTVSEVQAAESLRLARRARTGTEGSFYGIPVRSDHLAVVVDVSGSMTSPAVDERGDDPNATRISVAQRETLELLNSLPDGARVQLVWFSSKAQAWKRELTILDRRARGELSRVVRSWTPSGHTNLHDAMDRALADPSVDTVFLLSDGYPTTGALVDPLALRQDLRRRDPSGGVIFHTVSVGLDSTLLRWIAEDSGGTYTSRL